MKKLLFIAAVAAMTLCVASCKKDDPNGGKDEEQTVKREYRITSFGDNWSDPYTISYNADGKVASVVSPNDNRKFSYSGNTLTIENGGSVEYTCTLNSDGFATNVANAEHTWEITYDKNGFATSCKKDGAEACKQLIEDNNITYWTRWDGDNNFWRMKKATYYEKVNAGAVQTHWAEDFGFSRWMWEVRLLGNTSANVLETCRWWNFGDTPAEKTAVYDYEYDANGCITKEIKYYGVWNETDFSGLDEDTVTSFTWEKIK